MSFVLVLVSVTGIVWPGGDDGAARLLFGPAIDDRVYVLAIASNLPTKLFIQSISSAAAACRVVPWRCCWPTTNEKQAG